MDTTIDKIVKMCNGAFMVHVPQGAVQYNVMLGTGAGTVSKLDGYGLCHYGRGSVGINDVYDYVMAKATPVTMKKNGVFTVKAFNSKGKTVTLHCQTWTELLPSYIAGN